MIHNTHTHDLTSLAGTRTSFTAASDHDADARYRITLVATDSAGRSVTKVANVYPRSVNLTLASSPAGAPVTYAGTTAVAPLNRAAAVDFVSSISAAQSFTSGGTTYEFVAWSDGGTRARDVTIPATDAVLTALYQPQVWFEGETMTPTPNDGASIRNIAESGASGGSTISFRKSPSYATKQYTTAGAVDQITLRMRGDQCQGPPTAIVSIDNHAPRSIDVVPTTFTNFTLPLDAGNGGTAGPHTVKVEFNNNLVAGACDRNIYLDTISFRQVASVPPGASAYPRPRGATPQSVSLVPAFNPCRSSNRTHGAPLSHPSCAPPTHASANLSTGTPDANGAGANMTGSLSLTACESPRCASSDVLIRSSVTDVRCLPGQLACGALNTAAGRDYTGELQAVARLRITDRRNGTELTDAATTLDSPFRATIPCTPTSADATTGASCGLNTTANAILPGAVAGEGRTVWQVAHIEVYDGGTDGDAETEGNTLFLRPGLFVP